MGDVSDFQSVKIVGARMARTTVLETVQLLGISSSAVSKVMIAYKRDSKNSYTKQKSGHSSS